MKFRHLLLGSVFALAMPAAALAQSTISEGFYVGAYTGLSWANTFELEGPVNNDVGFDEAWLGGLEAGYRLGNGLSFGVDVSYNDHTVGDITGGDATRAGGDGDLNAWSYLGAVTYEFDTGSVIRPYLGLNVGVATVEFDNVGDVFTAGGRLDESDSALAYGIHTGLIYQASRNLELRLGYRFVETQDLSYQTTTGVEIDSDYQNHSVLLGLRWVFGAAPPPPPPAAPAPAPVAAPAATPAPATPPAPAISRNYTVFFDWDRATLTEDAQQVLRNVARNAETGKVTTIEVIGHADTSGAADYNQRLSLRRAEAVREFLISQGMGGNQVDIQGRGESELLVPTPDGVREPSNRRAVIIFP